MFHRHPGLPVGDKKRKRSLRKGRAGDGQKKSKKRRVAYQSTGSKSSSDEEWIPGMSPDRDKRKKKGGWSELALRLI
jgi:hypothetical protein